MRPRQLVEKGFPGLAHLKSPSLHRKSTVARVNRMKVDEDRFSQQRSSSFAPDGFLALFP